MRNPLPVSTPALDSLNVRLSRVTISDTAAVAGAAPQNAQAMPPAFYRVAEGRYVDGDRYETMRAEPGSGLPDRGRATILFPTNADRSLMSGREMSNRNRADFVRISQQEGLPDTVRHGHDSAPPRALVYLEQERELLSPDSARERLGNVNVHQQVGDQHVFLSSLGNSGIPTGNFINAPVYRQRNNAGQLRERLENDVALPGEADMARAGRARNAAPAPAQQRPTQQPHIPNARATLTALIYPANPIPQQHNNAAQQQTEVPFAPAVYLGSARSRQHNHAAQREEQIPFANAEFLGTAVPGQQRPHEQVTARLLDRDRDRGREGR